MPLNKIINICTELHDDHRTHWYYETSGCFNKEISEDIETIAFKYDEHSGYTLLFNPNYVNQTPPEDLQILILHELLHVLNKHDIRGVHLKEKERQKNLEFSENFWKIATDIVVNRQLKEGNLELSNDFKLPKDYGLEDKNNNDVFYSAEDYYEQLSTKSSIQGQNDTLNNSCSDNHKFWGQAQNIKSIEQTQRNIYRMTYPKQKEYEDYIPEEVKKIYSIESSQNANINWIKIIKGYIQKTIKNNKRKSYLRPSRRFGFGFKGIISDRISKVILAIDCSNSIDKELVESFSKEIISICKQYPVELRVIQCSCKVVNDKKYRNKQDFINYETIEIFGGTSYKPVFDIIEQNKYNPNILIYFTDLVLSTNEERTEHNIEPNFPDYIPKYKVIWAYCNAKEQYIDRQRETLQNYEQRIPFGYHIHIDIN